MKVDMTPQPLLVTPPFATNLKPGSSQMARGRRFLVAAVLVMATGCQSRREAVEVMCSAPSASGALEVDVALKSIRVATFLDDKVSNREARKLLEVLSALPPSERSAALRREADAQGVGPCELVDFWK